MVNALQTFATEPLTIILAFVCILVLMIGQHFTSRGMKALYKAYEPEPQAKLNAALADACKTNSTFTRNVIVLLSNEINLLRLEITLLKAEQGLSSTPCTKPPKNKMN